jgi:hypothetical protein
MPALGVGSDFGKEFGVEATKALVESRALESYGRQWGVDAMDKFLEYCRTNQQAEVVPAPCWPPVELYGTALREGTQLRADTATLVRRGVGCVLVAALVYRAGSELIALLARRYRRSPDDSPASGTSDR